MDEIRKQSAVSLELKQVFIIEKEPMMRRMLELTLKREGLSTYAVEDRHCHHVIIDLRPDLIIADLETLGSELTSFQAWLKSDPITQSIKFILMGKGEGVVLPKPLGPTGLYQQILESIKLIS